jgi:hypothetical protein
MKLLRVLETGGSAAKSGKAWFGMVVMMNHNFRRTDGQHAVIIADLHVVT